MLTRKDIPLSSLEWTTDKYQAFGVELDAVHADVKAKLGPEDVAHVKKVRKISRFSEAIEIGHSALHGAWDGLEEAKEFHSSRFRWDTPVEEEAWKKEHNLLHHQYTNVVGRDPDLNYGPLRVTEDTTWIPYHFIQLSQFFWTAPVFLWMIAVHATGLTDLAHPSKDATYAPVLPDKSPYTILSALYTTARKAIPYSLREFVFWPALE